MGLCRKSGHVGGVMVGDAEARDAVRRLMKMSDSMSDQFLGLAYVLAKRDRHEYARLLEAAEIAAKTVIRPLRDADNERSQVYKALDDPDADWSEAVVAMFRQGPIEFTGDEAFRRLGLMQSLEARFDEEMKKRNGNQDKRSSD